MASYRRPKGTVVRAVPDWNLNACAAIAIIGTESSGQISECGLINDAKDGRFLVVWELGISHAAGGGGDPAQMTCGAQLYQSPIFGVSLANTPLNPTIGMVPGSGWFNGTSAGFLTTGVLQPILKGNVDYHWPHNWPFCVIPPGFSLTVVFTPPAAGFDSFAANYVWEAARFT